MKKIMFALSLAALFSATTYAATATNLGQPQAPQASQPAPESKALAEFNKNVRLKLVQRGVGSENNQQVAVLNYEVENLGKKRIKSLEWISVFMANNQVFYAQGLKTEFKKAISPKKTETITVTLLLDKLPENARKIFADGTTPVTHVTAAKQLDFTNGKKIVVKE